MKKTYSHIINIKYKDNNSTGIIENEPSKIVDKQKIEGFITHLQKSRDLIKEITVTVVENKEELK